jgi:hypothetical protein
MKSSLAGALLSILAVAACSKGADTTNQNSQSAAGAAAPAAAASADNAPYFNSLPLKELMPHVMQYAGDGIWKRQGYVVNATGEHSLFPKNDQEWEDGESAARTLAEVTNTLLVPGRRVPEKNWDDAVIAVRKVALKAADAAEKHDAKAWFAAGSELDEACDVCHVQYDPTFKKKKQPS